MNTKILLIINIILLFEFSFITGKAEEIINSNNLLEFKGVTEPVHEAILSSPVEGTVEKIFFQEGDWVEKDDTIIKLDRLEQELAMNLQYNIWKNTASLDESIIEEKNHKALYDSAKRLFETNRSVSKDELTQLKMKYEHSHYKRIELENKEKQELIQYEMTKEILEKRTLKAPINGIITNIFLNKGERCKSNDRLLKLVDPRICYFKCNIEERFTSNICISMNVLLHIQVGKKILKKNGKVIFISPVVDPASGLLKVKVEFENKNLLVRPGVSGKMILNPEKTVSPAIPLPQKTKNKFQNSDYDTGKDYKNNENHKILNWIEAWRQNWLNMKIDNYLLCYTTMAIQGNLKGRSKIREQKTLLWQKAPPEAIKVENIKIDKTDKFVRVSFVQKYYDKTGYNDIGKKTLILTKNENDWFIVKELWENINDAN